ncbi:MAG: alpha/beta hydrolase [Christensenellales bacterium]
MKKALKVVSIILAIIAAIILVVMIFLFWVSKQPAVKECYFDDVYTSALLETTYKQKGDFDVSLAQYKTEAAYKNIYVWYPSNMTNDNEKYPLVVMANGTGVPASKYKPVFDHLASWGFIVVGNDDESSWNGSSSAESLDFVLNLNNDTESIFFNKIDVDNIGIAGHSQGGVAVVNAATEFDNSHLYKAAYIASITFYDLAAELGWNYDISKVEAPVFMVAGTGTADAETISPLSEMHKNFSLLDSSNPSLIARRKDTDHGEMLANADSYMTAWFMYWLKDDHQAKTIFFGENAEIDSNENWQDVYRNY